MRVTGGRKAPGRQNRAAPPRPSLDRLTKIYASSLVVVILFLLLPLLATLAPSFGSAFGDQDFADFLPDDGFFGYQHPEGFQLAPLEATHAQEFTAAHSSPGSPGGLYLGLGMYRPRPAGQQIDGYFRLIAIGQLTTHGFDVCAEGSQQSVCTVGKDFRDMPLTLHLGINDSKATGGSRFTINEPVTLQELFGTPRPRVAGFPTQVPIHEVVRPITITATGPSGLYPLDFYDSTLQWSVIPFPNMSIGNQSAETLQVTYNFGRSTEETPPIRAHIQGNIARVLMHGRPALQRWFLVGISFIPFAFALMFIHILFFNPSTKKLPLRDFVVALAAAILAIMPLRAVLVPPDLQGVTLLDVWLAFGAGLLVALTLAKYCADVVSPSSRRQPVARTKRGRRLPRPVSQVQAPTRAP